AGVRGRQAAQRPVHPRGLPERGRRVLGPFQRDRPRAAALVLPIGHRRLPRAPRLAIDRRAGSYRRRARTLDGTSMTDAAPLSWQPSLLAGDAEPAIDPAFARLTRIQLDQRAWVDHTTGWVTGSHEVPPPARRSGLAAPRRADVRAHGRAAATHGLVASRVRRPAVPAARRG